MSTLATWLLEELLARHDLRPTRRSISEPELDALADRYGFVLPPELRALIRLDAAYEIPRIGELSLKVRPPWELLSDEPTPVTRTGFLPLAVRFGGLYPLGTTPTGALYALDIASQEGRSGAVYCWQPNSWRLAFAAPSLKAFFQRKILRGEIFAEGASPPEAAARLCWVEAFLAGRHAQAARFFIEKRPPLTLLEVEASLFSSSPTRALYWLLDTYLIGDEEAHERAQTAAARARAPLVGRLCRFLSRVKAKELSFFDDLEEGRAQFFFELASRLDDEHRQSRLWASLSPKAPAPRIAEALHLADEETARAFAEKLAALSQDTDPIRQSDLSALRAFALARAGAHSEAVALADILAWEWRQDPWYGARPGEAERLSYLIHAYRLSGRRDRGEGLLAFVREKAPSSGAPLAAQIEFYLDDGDLARAKEELLSALRVAPGSPELHACRARLLARGESVSWADPSWPAFLRDLAEEAMTGDAAARISALERLCQALAARGDQPPLPLPFLLSIIEADPAGRPGALRAISQNPFDEAIPVLVSWARRADDPAGRQAAHVLGRFTSEAASQAVAQLIDEDVFVQNPELLEGLARGVLRGTALKRALLAALERRGESNAPALLRALLPCADAEVFEVALRYLRPECGRETGAQAIALLGAIGDERALPQLGSLAASADPVIAHAAREAIARIGGKVGSQERPPARPRLALLTEPQDFDRELRQGDRECANQIVQIASGRAAWEQNPARRDDLQSIRALALARSGMLRDAVELADVLAWGWRQDPLCGERPGEAERLARLVDTYRVAGRHDRARPLLDFLRAKAPQAAAPLAVEIDLLLDANQDEQAQALLQQALLDNPGSIWLHSCRARLLSRGRTVSWADPSWPSAIREAAERACSPDLAQRVRALETLAGAIRVRREEGGHPGAIPMPFLSAIAQHDEPQAARAALLAIAAHPFPEAIKVLRGRAEGQDPDLAAISVAALAELPAAEADLAALLSEGLYRRVPNLLPSLATGSVRGEILREALLRAIEREGVEEPWLGPWLLRALAPSAKAEDAERAPAWLSPSSPTELRKAAIELVRASGHPSLSEWVLPLTQDDDHEVAQAARAALSLPEEERSVG